MVAAVGSVISSASSVTGMASSEQSDRFLKLLVAQMKNQDPLNPLDNAQVTTQMAQISTVAGIEKLNQTLQAFTQVQAFQAVGMVGHSVLVPGNVLTLVGGQTAAGLDLPTNVDDIEISIFDANGNPVRSFKLGPHEAGVVTFGWDGRDASGNPLPDGEYSYRVRAVAGGANVAVTSLAFGTVNSILMDRSGPSLSVDGIGLVELGQVREII
ncbi:MAG: flagellar hook assembly protein FlgD [Methylophilaceae bacterium]|nr:flagellar hook assembly protein FlgD [Methylophilaceae bacterium]